MIGSANNSQPVTKAAAASLRLPMWFELNFGGLKNAGGLAGPALWRFPKMQSPGTKSKGSELFLGLS